MDARAANTAPSVTRLADYAPPDVRITHMEMDIHIGAEETAVTSTLTFQRNPLAKSADIILNGEHQKFIKAALNGQDLTPDAYILTATHFTLKNAPETGRLTITSTNRPQDNTALEGLYKAGDALCTQCEAEGFRRITYFPDRPDVLSIFRVRITADKSRHPILLSNGNLIESQDLAHGQHTVLWEDPFPKPCYLFALVAGRLGVVEDHFITRSRRKVLLQIYVEPGNEDQCGHAMTALKNSMKWDEDTFGLEYDLDRFMIVAVSFFNMGAMENKGLNIFNDRYILARADVATDADFSNIEAVVAHEYFHNWTGNRVTCRDWFQLSLKEGLTVFRDQEFSSDMNSRAVERITNVRNLRAYQFIEDSGPNAHPIRPEQFITIDNFYTATVYEKGSEVIRMIHTLLGKEGFRKGMDLYFQRHDGQAVRCEDFVAAMADANNADFTQFQLWYKQAGTPHLKISSTYDETVQTLRLDVAQTVPPTPGQPDKQPMLIPLRLSLLGANGTPLPLQLEGENTPQGTERVLQITKAQQSFTFTHLPHKPVASLLRDFSAPVTLDYPYTEDELAFLAASDNDPFARWEAGQRFATNILLKLITAAQTSAPLTLHPGLTESLRRTLAMDLDAAFKALCLTLPSEGDLAQKMVAAGQVIDVDAIHTARQFLRRALGAALKSELKAVYDTLRKDDPRDVRGEAMGRRALKNTCLAYLAQNPDDADINAALHAETQSFSMTNVVAALGILSDRQDARRTEAFADFYQKWQKDPLVLDKWFAIQAQSARPDVLQDVQTLMQHPAFDIKNPNRVRALIGAFAHGNQWAFNAGDGSGYAFLAEQVKVLDTLNPQIAARLLGAFARWRQFDKSRQEKIRTALESVLALPGLSPNAFEIVSKTLAY